MVAIQHKLVIKALPAIVYNAVTTQNGLESWWAKKTIAKPELGFVNIFTFGTFRNEMKITTLQPDAKVEWQITSSIKEWVGTSISFDLEEQDSKTVLRFRHSGWEAMTDTFASCNYDWGRFMTSLKQFCETGTGMPS